MNTAAAAVARSVESEMTTVRETVPAAAAAVLADSPDRRRLFAIQRARLIAAMIQACAQNGASNVTVGDVVERSGVSRRTFYEIFTDREHCFLTALKDATSRLEHEIASAYDPTAPWTVRVKNTLSALLAFLENEPDTAKILLLDSLTAGPTALQSRERLTAKAIVLIDEGRTTTRKPVPAPPIVAEGTVRAVLSILQARVAQTNKPRLTRLTNELMSMIVLPYLGPTAAHQQLHQQQTLPPTKPNPTPTPPLNTLKDLNLRLTYRTIRVLNAIAANPGASNRTIGQHAGITDQGQTSKLLTRLQHHKLIANNQPTPTRGAPNAWTLTNTGQKIQHTLTP